MSDTPTNAVPELPDDAAAEGAILKRFAPEALEDTPAPEADTAPEAAEGDEAPAEAPEEPEAPKRTLAGDDADVEVPDGEGVRRVPVSELRALLAREAEIATRDTETATALRRANDEGERAVGIMGQMLQQARAEYARYAGVDFALAAQSLPRDAYEQLKADAKEAYGRVQFLEQTGNDFIAQTRANREAAIQAERVRCDQVLAADTDPVVKGWDAKARSETVAYAISQGLSEANANAIVQPAVIKLLRKAALYDKGMKAAAAVKATATSAPKGVMKPGAAAPANATTSAEALSKLRRTGSTDDAAAAILARFGG